MTETDIAEFQLPESCGNHAGDTKLALHPSLRFLLLLFSMLCITSAGWCPFPQSWECYSLSVCITWLLNFAFFCSLSVPPILNFGFKITLRLDSLLPSNVSSSKNKTLTPQKSYTQDLSWRESLCSSKFTALFSSSKISSEFSGREAAPTSKAFGLL